jgi:tryptophan synthase alpha chain
MNPLLQYGVEKFLDSCVDSGIDGLIIPDLPPDEFEERWSGLFEERSLSMIFLITSRTPLERIAHYDSLSQGFLYAVSSEATTGGTLSGEAAKQEYFQSLKTMRTANPILVGFGIADRESYQSACSVSSGAVIGSAFLRALEGEGDISSKVKQFVGTIR